MAKRIRKIWVFALVFIALLSASRFAFCATELFDSIDEFGERRYVRHAIERFDPIKKFGENRFYEPTPSRLKAGPVIFHPTLKTSATFDDNILLEAHDAKKDIVFNVRPGVILEIPVDTHQIVLGYEADFENFAKNTYDQNDQNQNAFALIDLSFPNWYINIYDRFRETSGRSGTSFSSRIPRYDHIINPKIGYHWNRMTVETAFSHQVRDFRRSVDDRLDYQLSTWTQTVYLDLFARLKAFVDYSYAQIDYDDDFLRHGQIHQARLGLEGQLLPNLETDLYIGPQFRGYDEPERDDFNSWVGSMMTVYHFTPQLSFEGEFTREALESTHAGSNYYVTHFGRFGVNYKFNPQWSAYTEALVYRNVYSERATLGGYTAIRKDKSAGVNVGLRYEFREWMSFELAYNYLRRNSNFSRFDYTNNRISLSSSIYY